MLYNKDRINHNLIILLFHCEKYVDLFFLNKNYFLFQRVSEIEVEICSSVMYSMKDESFNPPQMRLTTFQSKSELPIRHTIIGPKLETVINGHGEDS